jgi:catalase
VSETDDTTGAGGELHQGARGRHGELTTNEGGPIADNQNSLRSALRGPTLIEDFVLREKITHFDHERIPERIVHARGTGLHGHFTLTDSLAEFTRAKVLTDVGRRTPVFARFSTVAGGAGSADTPRDVRGFAVKFYTNEGNWDLVGNNIPVFFIQDAMKFPDLVHAVKMEPDRGFPQAATAHDTFWDFISLTPESIHTIMWAMSDRTLPRSLAMMEGFGVHTFRLLNEDGESTFVKFHWRPRQGVQSTTWDEAVKLAGADPDAQRRHLFESIAAGEYPEWDLAVQLFTDAEAERFPFDVLDPTKLVPEELVPLRVIGKIVLDRWPDNFFAETEQVAFCPSHVVDGIDFSNDPLLQGRLFSYLDTQLSRLGGPNFHQLPVNAPRCPFANHQLDGHMQTRVPVGRVNYEPSSLDPLSPRESPQGFRSAIVADDGHKGRARPASFADHYSQARLFYLSQTTYEQAHLASALVFELSKVETEHVRTAMLGHLQIVDLDLARRVAAGLGVSQLPEPPVPRLALIQYTPSPSLRTIDNRPRALATLHGRVIGILVADGSEGATVTTLRKAAEEAGARVKIVAPAVGGVTLASGKHLAADGQLAGTPSLVFDAVALVLSPEGAQGLARDAAAVDFVRDAYGHLKAIAFDDGAAAMLVAANIRVDDGVLDAKLTDLFIEAAKVRQWDREASVRRLA